MPKLLARQVEGKNRCKPGLTVNRHDSYLQVKLWGAETGQHLLTLNGHTDELRSVAFSSYGNWLMSASRDGMVKLWDTENP